MDPSAGDPSDPAAVPGTPASPDPGAAPGTLPSPGRAPDGDGEHLRRIQAVRDELAHLETLLCGGHRPISSALSSMSHPAHPTAGWAHVPAWLRVTRGESRWPVATVIVVAIGLQLLLPDRLTLVSHWLMPTIELTLLAALVVANPSRFDRESPAVRIASLTLTSLLSLANGWSALRLATELVAGHAGEDAAPLLSTGGSIWLTNIIAFALWYWQFDRGGPAARAHARRREPDFCFVQMQNPELAHPDWEPGFVDYLYLSFTNATAFSPTDVLPLSRWAKLTMTAQTLISLVTVALVIARAVNILK
jgi:hypothetical protein